MNGVLLDQLFLVAPLRLPLETVCEFAMMLLPRQYQEAMGL